MRKTSINYSAFASIGSCSTVGAALVDVGVGVECGVVEDIGVLGEGLDDDSANSPTSSSIGSSDSF